VAKVIVNWEVQSTKLPLVLHIAYHRRRGRGLKESTPTLLICDLQYRNRKLEVVEVKESSPSRAKVVMRSNHSRSSHMEYHPELQRL